MFHKTPQCSKSRKRNYIHKKRRSDTQTTQPKTPLHTYKIKCRNLKKIIKSQQGEPHHSPSGPGAPRPFDGSEAPPPGSAGCNDCMQTPRGGGRMLVLAVLQTVHKLGGVGGRVSGREGMRGRTGVEKTLLLQGMESSLSLASANPQLSTDSGLYQ